MDVKGFRSYLRGRKFNNGLVEASVAFVKDADEFMKTRKKSLDNANLKDLEALVSGLIKSKKNTYKNLLALARYWLYMKNKGLTVSVIERLDGAEVMDKIAKKVEKKAGKVAREKIYRGIKFPPLGATGEGRPAITKKIIERMEKNLGEGTCRKILLSDPHGGGPMQHTDARKRFLAAKNIDDFLAKEHAEYISELKGYMRDGKLYFTQEIDRQVLDFVRNNPMITGVRKGGIIYTIKIPYMAKKYLNEKDPVMKRYHYCHCMWAKEAIKSGKIKVPLLFCYCSAGFHKSYFAAAFGEDIDVDVIETVLDGGMVCKFAVHIPKSAMRP